MKKYNNNSSPLKFAQNLINNLAQNILNLPAVQQGFINAQIVSLNGAPREQINDLCEFDDYCRPVFALEKHMAVLRKGPTMPLTLEMYKYAEETAGVNPVSVGAVVASQFTGYQMDQSANYCVDPTIGCPGILTPNQYGTAVDGTDISIFYDQYKQGLTSGSEIRIPIDIATTGEDWDVDDQLIIEHVYIDIFGHTQTASCRVEIINPAQMRDDPTWVAGPWSPSNLLVDPAGLPLNWGGVPAVPGDTWGAQSGNVPAPFILGRIMSISGVFPIESINVSDMYQVTLVQIPPLFKVKFPRFSYRYKYEDGEYSVFAPWSEIAFIPSRFDFSPKKGYNLGMENAMRALKVLNWRPKDCPHDVVQIDILYKESNSPSIYTVETFKNDDPIEPASINNHWNTVGNGGHFGRYIIKTELIHQVVASNQLLRPWDNVPRKALGQEITANRLIFANYLEGYNLEAIDYSANFGKESLKPAFSTSISELSPWAQDPENMLGEPVKSLKSQRTYQLGVVYRDRYGRETPVLTSKSGSVEIAKTGAKIQNRLNVNLTSKAPYWAESYTFYIKETANEYYNLAMDRWYDAEDGGVWMSFPSVERNKITEDSNLILKKKHDSNEFTDYDVSYKVLSIANNAPKFIKTDDQYWGALPIHLPPPGWGNVGHWDTGMLWPSGLPLPNRMNIDVIAEYFDQSLFFGLKDKSKAQVRIVQSPGVPSAFNAVTSQLTNKTLWYDIANISYIGSEPSVDANGVEIPGQAERLVRIALETAFGNDAMFCQSDSALLPTVPGVGSNNSNLSMSRGLLLEARTKEEKDKAQFEGRFFVKILRDANVESNIVDAQRRQGDTYQVLQSKDIKYICAAHPGRPDWNFTDGAVYDPLTYMAVEAVSHSDPPNFGHPNTHGNKQVGSYGPQVAGTGATYIDHTGATAGEPSAAPFWSFGPEMQRTRGVFRVPGDPDSPNSGYWHATYKQHLLAPSDPNNVTNNWEWPDASFPPGPGTGWPAYPISFWNPTNVWGISTTEYDNPTLGDSGSNHQYVHLINQGAIYPPSGILDLSEGWNSLNVTSHNGLHPLPAVANFVNPNDFPLNQVVSGANYDNSIGYSAGANPWLLPGIWGDQSDFLTTAVPPNCAGAWPTGCQPIYIQSTPDRLKQDWYGLWRGRDDVEETWPLGRFSPDRWFFDKVGAANGHSGAGIWDDTVKGVSYMHLSFWGIGAEVSTNRDSNLNLMLQWQETEVTFADAMSTVGTKFRFKQDPDQTVYTISTIAVENEIWNYESPVGQWAYDNGSGVTVGGVGMTAGVLPPFGGNLLEPGTIAGKHSFLSDIICGDDAEKSGGAPYNRRIRYTIGLDKIIGQEGPTAFHPIKNHIDASGKANIKRGKQKYDTSMAHVTTGGGGLPPAAGDWYNLSSYWNATGGAGNGNVDQPDDITDALYDGTHPSAHIGLHERGLNETTIEIVAPYTGRDRDFPISNNPAIWETEPKEDIGLDIYYAASPSYPIRLKRFRSDSKFGGGDFESGPDEYDYSLPGGTNANWYDHGYRGEEMFKVGSIVTVVSDGGYTSLGDKGFSRICGTQGDLLWISEAFQFQNGGVAVMLSVGAKIRIKWDGEGRYYGGGSDEEWIELYITEVLDFDMFRVGDISGDPGTHNLRRGLSYYNCYSYGTGVESNRVRDDFNAITIDKGVKASMPLAEQYKEERKGSSLIFSGIYNSTSGVNRTNQFIQAEPITKDLNPVNGSIQKLFTRDTDLVTFCENKVFKILAKKDALFNADGNTNVTSNTAVLGQSIPFVGEYGISRNPESLASQSYRLYFADKDRGAILRLSRDGLTPISDQGMKDWFKDNLRFATSIIGSHDDRENQYNVTIKTADQDNNIMAYTVSYTEDKKGWTSFKSFIQQGGISHKNIYYTFPSNQYNSQNSLDPWGVNYMGGVHSNAETYQHNLDVEIKRLVLGTVNGLATFPVLNGTGTIVVGMNVTGNGIPIDTTVAAVNCTQAPYACSITLAFTVDPVTNGVYLTNNTELTFSTARNQFYDSTYNNYSMVKVMFNGAQGSVKRYKTLNYEGSQARVNWGDDPAFPNIVAPGLNYQVVENVVFGQDYYDNHSKLGWYVDNMFTDLQEGKMLEFVDKENKWFNDIKGYAEAGIGDFLDTGEFSLQGLGFSDVAPAVVPGCIDPAASNYNVLANTDDGSCLYPDNGCTDPTMWNFNPLATVDDGSCIPYIYGCMDPLAINHDCINGNTAYPCNDNVNTNDFSCIYDVEGCTDPAAINYDPLATINDNSCTYCIFGCTDPFSTGNYDPLATCDDGSCFTCVFGCLDNPAAQNYLVPDVDCFVSLSGGGYNIWDGLTGECWTTIAAGGTGDPANGLRPCCPTCDDGSCFTGSTGCTDIEAVNFNPSATIPDNASCEYEGCLQPQADNFQTFYYSSNAVYNFTDQDGVVWTYGPAAITQDCFGNYGGVMPSACCHFSGCMDPTADNFNVNINIDDGSCIYSGLPINGCMDPLALNYNQNATTDDNNDQCNYCDENIITIPTNAISFQEQLWMLPQASCPECYEGGNGLNKMEILGFGLGDHFWVEIESANPLCDPGDVVWSSTYDNPGGEFGDGSGIDKIQFNGNLGGNIATACGGLRCGDYVIKVYFRPACASPNYVGSSPCAWATTCLVATANWSVC